MSEQRLGDVVDVGARDLDEPLELVLLPLGVLVPGWPDVNTNQNLAAYHSEATVLQAQRAKCPHSENLVIAIWSPCLVHQVDLEDVGRRVVGARRHRPLLRVDLGTLQLGGGHTYMTSDF